MNRRAGEIATALLGVATFSVAVLRGLAWLAEHHLKPKGAPRWPSS